MIVYTVHVGANSDPRVTIEYLIIAGAQIFYVICQIQQTTGLSLCYRF